MNRHPIIVLTISHFKSFFREPGAVFWSFFFPVLMAWILGVAFSQKQEKVYKVYIHRKDSTELSKTFKLSETYTFYYGQEQKSPVSCQWVVGDEAEIDKALKEGRTALYLKAGEGRLEYHFDPANAEAENLFLWISRSLAKDSEISYKMVKIEKPGGRYIDYLLPGLLAMGVMNSSVWGMSWFLIEARMKKLLRRMVATPMRKSHFVLSHFFARILLCVFESLTLMIFAKIYFGTQITGSIGAMMALYASGVLAFGGIGLLLASRTQSTGVGNSLINATVLPMTIMGGVFFSYYGFPEWLIWWIQWMPLTQLADGMRGIFNQGYGFTEVLLPIGLLSGLGALCYLTALRIFRWY